MSGLNRSVAIRAAEFPDASTSEAAFRMRYVLIIAAALLGLMRAAWADNYTPYADLVCDPAKNIALARFMPADDPDPPRYAKLPAGVDGDLSSKPGTGRRLCVLANGWEIKLRNGQAQAFAYGAGGASPPEFFSLWVNHRKVFSKQYWSAQNYAGSEPQIAGVVITPSHVTICEWERATRVNRLIARPSRWIWIGTRSTRWNIRATSFMSGRLDIWT